MLNSCNIRAKKNIVSSCFGEIIVILLYILLPKLMIETYGSESYGAISSINQLLAHITLLEGGIGGVARSALYKPLLEKDIYTINSIVNELRRFLRVIAYIFSVYLLIIACIFKDVSKINSMDWQSTFVLVIVLGISVFAQYFIGFTNEVLLRADQRKYIINIVSISVSVLNAISIIVLTINGVSLITVYIVSGGIFLIRPLALMFYVKNHYQINNKYIAIKKIYLNQKWSAFGQHISYFLYSNTDVVVLTFFADLKSVAVYSLYTMIVSRVQNLSVSFSSGMEAVFGDMLARNETKKLNEYFQLYENILSIVSVILFSITAVLIVPFVKLYTDGVTDADYVQPFFALIMIFNAIFYCMRLPYHAMVVAAGHFKQTSMAAYVEALINIVLSIILVLKYGLIGVAVGTLIAIWFKFYYYVRYISKNILEGSGKYFLKRFFINFGTLAINGISGYVITSYFNVNNYLNWTICGLILVVIMSVFTLGGNYMFFGNEVQSLLMSFCKHKCKTK